MSAIKEQVGGNHYQKYKISPLQFAEKIGLSPTVFCAYKYVVRYKDKNGLEDLQKALHCALCFQQIGQSKYLVYSQEQLAEFLDQFDSEHAELIRSVIIMQIDKGQFGYFERCVENAIKDFNKSNCLV